MGGLAAAMCSTAGPGAKDSGCQDAMPHAVPESAMRDTPRPRRSVGPCAFTLLRPVLRYSHSRDAYVLRVVGNRYGPVLRHRARDSDPSS